METIEALSIVQDRLTEHQNHCKYIEQFYDKEAGPKDSMNEYVELMNTYTEALSIVFDLANRTVYR